MALITDELDRIADQVGIRIENIGGATMWEAQPVFLHQETVFRIQVSIRQEAGDGSGCGCVHVSDVSIRFPDGSQKRPDIAIFCHRPANPKKEITVVPEAVIEIISEGYEAKDLVFGIPFYLSQGVKDVVVLDPDTNLVTHVRHDSRVEHTSPVEIVFECGCRCTV